MSWFEPQIETRARLDAELVERAYGQLAASVSKAGSATAFCPGELEQVDGAVEACLRYCGMEPGRVPDSVKDVEQRIEWLCRPTGTMFRKVRLERGWHKQAFGALLGRLDTGETVALLPMNTRGYCYLEPGSGRRVKITPDVAERIAEEAYVFYKPMPARSMSLRDFFVFLSSTLDKGDYLRVLLAAAVVALIGLIPPQANQIAFGKVVPSGDANLIAPIGCMLLGVAIGTVLIGTCRNLIMSRVGTKLSMTVEAAAFSRLLALPTSFFKKYASGDLASRLTQVTVMANMIAQIVLGSGLTSILSLIYVFQIAVYAPALALPALVVVVVQAVLMAVVTILTMRYERATLEASMKLSGTVTALLGGIQKIKLAGAEDRAFATWAKGYSSYASAAYNRPAVLRAMPALVAFVGLLGNIVIYYLAARTQVSVADYMAFSVAYGQVTSAIMALAGVMGQAALIRPTFEKVAPILEAEPEIAEDKPSVTNLNGSIDVSGVSFRYADDQPYVLQDLSFKVKPGEYVAIVGPSGCGKSTILRLLLGFEEAERGSIFYGPHDVRKVDLRSLRANIGVVMQDGKLFLGDIASNITISTPTATLDDAWEAAEIAGIAEDIRKMPMGMQTIVSEGGGGVSGGQRQRLMIARAVCGKRRILMFDEATSALDNKTQKHVSDSLEALKCTRVVVAHRLSTVRHCDRILVVDGGRIAEEGTYNELLEKDGIFADLVARQRLDTEGA